MVQPLSYIPPIGLGTWQIPKSKAANVVKFALESGYRHIDAALIYGNEKQVGEGISSSKVPRSSLWVTGKLWNNAHRPSAVRPALEQTLHDLNLEYLDLYLIHWPVAFEPGSLYNTVLDHETDLRETWSAMEDLVREGLVRQIGISNFNKAQTKQILRHATITPTVHEFECHLYLQQSEFVKWTLNHGMRVIAYSPLGNMNPIYNSSLTPLLKDPSLLSFADRKGLTVAQLALAWNMHRGVIVIPKSEHTERVAENFHAQSVSLTAEDIEFLNSLDRKSRFNNPSKEWDVQLYSEMDGV
ncbi:putative dihydrodiol dehydrogenase [Aspergillus ellipticus CBS 707.79]|uniref:D-xylose reductase [NAD(P)H] n=1 Tax=Aspergillus ellipticus CBS 707.79 TaxID=1448320 RepID=A0A319F302_9EURO|nr:putative dihydrodiol dehydrogenase [Aspergillus ellipticus CBS 707.79]